MGLVPSSPAPSRPNSTVAGNETPTRVASPTAPKPGKADRGSGDRGLGTTGGTGTERSAANGGGVHGTGTLGGAEEPAPVDEGARGSTLSKKAKSKLEAIKTSIREDPTVLRVRRRNADDRLGGLRETCAWEKGARKGRTGAAERGGGGGEKCALEGGLSI
jgi:hypothetical protein